ncbi:unnamed protein product, partial [Symbiodinium sp. CCMP2456]
MSRPELVAVAVVFGVCGRADCRPGTCQTLEAYFQCEFTGSGAAGGGSTIAVANCLFHQIVVRVSLELPSLWDNGSDAMVSATEDVVRALTGLNSEEPEDMFVLRALYFGLESSTRPLRRWIPSREQNMEQRWREEALWHIRLVFAVAAPGAECEFCVRTHVSVPVYRAQGTKFLKVEPLSGPYTAHVSVFQKVTPVDLGVLSPLELVRFLVGFVADISAFAHANLWHDCHIGSLLMHMEPSQDDRTFYWHDFGGASSRTHSPRPQVLGEFVRKMRETIRKIQEAAHARIPGFPSIPELDFNGNDTAVLKMNLRVYNVAVQNHVMRWSGDKETRQSALFSLHRVLSRSRHDELELMLAEGTKQAQTKTVWVRRMHKAGQTVNESLPAFKITVPVTD